MTASKTYPLHKVHVYVPDAMFELETVLKSGYINEGTAVSRLNEALQAYLMAQNLTLTNSCTSALTLALRLAGVKHDSTVVSTPMTCVATNTPIVTMGAQLKWVDIDPMTGMIDPAVLQRVLHNTSNVKAVVAVAWGGTPPDLEALGDLTHRYGAKLILDAAHAFDATYKSHPVHRWADYTCYSFQAIKHFTTGDGGALVCDSYRDHARARSLKWSGLDRDAVKNAAGDWKGQQWDADVKEPGYKFNMNNVAAAIGLSQLPHLSRVMDGHRQNAALYDHLLADSQAVRPLVRPAGAGSSFWVYTVRLDPTRSKLQRDELLKALNDEGIMAGLVHVPNDGYTCFKESRELRNPLPGLRQFAATQLSLPCGWWLDADDIQHIARRVTELAG